LKIKTFSAESPLSGFAEWGTLRLCSLPSRRVPNLRKGDSAGKVFSYVTTIFFLAPGVLTRNDRIVLFIRCPLVFEQVLFINHLHSIAVFQGF
jgi:hypothetical protein